MDFLILSVMMVVLALAALRWGVDSLEDAYSPEWERRQRWYGFH